MVRILFQKSLTKLSDEELMVRVKEKDDDRAFDELYHRYSRRLMGFFYRQMNQDENLAADFVQEAFLKTWSSRAAFSRDTFRTWLFCIAYNLCKNHYRHWSYEQSYLLEVMTHYDEAGENTVECQLSQEEFDQALQLELEQLSPPIRMLFALRFEEDLTVPQISSIMGLPEGTVKSRLYSLTHTLKNKLQHYGKF